MRLIDADNIISVCEILSEKGSDPHYWNQLISIIKDVPTIDAIPVEWLRSQMKNNPNDIESAYDDICISELMEKWQKEQEAHGT